MYYCPFIRLEVSTDRPVVGHADCACRARQVSQQRVRLTGCGALPLPPRGAIQIMGQEKMGSERKRRGIDLERIEIAIRSLRVAVDSGLFSIRE